MAEFKHTSPEVVLENEPIIFKNNTDASFSVTAGICFFEDGEYHVSVHNKVVTVTKERSKEKDASERDGENL